MSQPNHRQAATTTQAPTTQARGRRGSHAIAPEPWFLVSAATAQKYSARAVTSASAPRVSGQSEVRPSVYCGEQILIRGAIADSQPFELLKQIAGEHDLVAEIDADDSRIAEQVAALELEELPPSEIVTRVKLRPAPGRPSDPPDPWLVMQHLRAHPSLGAGVGSIGLDHLVGLHEYVHGSPFVSGLEYVHGSPVVGGLEYVHGSPYPTVDGVLSQYGLPGFGGRAPAAWVGRPPHRVADAQLPTRRPVIAIFDTGAGVHPWLTDDIVRRDLDVGGVPMDQVTGESSSDAAVLLGTLDEDSGHGTFIAGLIRQTCPDADLLAVQVMGPDGIVTESDLVNALYLLLVRQVSAFRAKNPRLLVDVLTLSLGYYHEQPGDEQLDPMLLAPIRALGRHGVAVVASAGNDATQRPSYPAAFTPHDGGPVRRPEHGVIPVVSVGARNPDGTIALFSNAGPWVNAYRTGAALVSTMPTNLNGGPTASVITHGPGGTLRETIDPDDFKGGFGTWSGTSFAVPIFAGEIAQHLIDDKSLEPRRFTKSTGECSPENAVARGWKAVSKSLAHDVHPLARPTRAGSGRRHR